MFAEYHFTRLTLEMALVTVISIFAATCSTVWIIALEVLVLFGFPLLAWILIRNPHKKKAYAHQLHSTSYRNGPVDVILFTECIKVIHYFGQLGQDISTTPLWKVFGEPEPQPPLVSPSLASEIARFDLLLKVGELENVDDKRRLILIHDYLSAELSCCTKDDNSITLETVDEALNEPLAKLRILDYCFGAVYFFILTIVLQAYSGRVDSDSSEVHRADSLYTAVFYLSPGASLPGSSTTADTVTKTDTPRQSSTKRDTIIIQQKVSSELTIKIDTALARKESYNSVFVIRKLLLDQLRLLACDLRAFPFFCVDCDSRDSLSSASGLLSTSKNYYYNATQVTSIFSKFILPMLYGLLGAYLFVIRTIAAQIKVFDLTWKRMIRHRARLIFGLFVGMFFGYLFKSSGTVGGFIVTTFILAFIGGYQVELLFTLFDKITTAFSSEKKN